jgi:protein-L-isoaspartate(D-aspartate) O-methyltransferase
MEMWNNCKIVTIKIGMEPEMDLEQTRFNMVEQQIRPWDVLDQKVLNLLFELRREEFVPVVYRSLAFVDMEIPLGHGEVMLAPKMEARILQELQVKKTDRILEVGSGSGYLTALLARQGEHVYSVEIVPELKTMAEKNLQAHGISNVTLEQGDAARGWTDHGPYDVIVLTGSTPVLPQAFQNSLKTGGRLFAVVGDAPVMEAVLVTCVAQEKETGVYNTVSLFETCISPLKNAQQPERFVF